MTRRPPSANLPNVPLDAGVVAVVEAIARTMAREDHARDQTLKGLAGGNGEGEHGVGIGESPARNA
jgi:hypothetical protein